ncbi:hypothetical protein HOLleu_43939 [Holothuria leucospilota]|uniref:Uncharacterized protein n=1 Tax=Holothuria leucospilota TaxID=206669 RepID=A0A9Q0YA73_HOLLE|nr:hypothetical protein HOLleu_43939 [Holothuria leucospilota]
MVGCDVVPTAKEPSPNENNATDLNRECENTAMTLCDVLLASGLASPESMSSIEECEDTEMVGCDVVPTAKEPSPNENNAIDLNRECENTEMVGCDVVPTAKEPSPNENNATDLNGECENTELSERDDTSGPDSDNDKDYSPEGDESGESEDETSSSDERRTNDEHVSDSEDSESIELPLRVGRLDILNNVVNDTKSPENTTSLDNSENEYSDSSTEPEDEEVYRDVDNKGLYIRRVLTSSTTKTGRKKKRNRVYNARHCCPFCHHLYINFSQHILGKVHEAEPEVQKIVSIRVSKDESDEKKKEKERERKKLIAILRNKGDNDHNKKVLKRKKGEVILARRDGDENQESFSIKEYGPCPMCFEWLKLSVIARHQGKCPANKERPTHQTKGHLLIQSSVIAGKLHAKASEKMLKEVYPIMRNDAIGLLARSDSLIIALGNQWLVRNLGNPLMRKYYVSAVMRLSSRLLMVLRQMATPSTGTNMEDYLDPTYFTYVARAALKVAQQDNEDEEDLKAPSNALKLSYDIKRMANIKLAQAIQARDQGKKRSAQDFLQLMSIEWSTKLERVLLEERKHTDKKPLPLPNDIVKFNRYLTNEATACDLTDTSYANFKKIVTLTLAALITYNRRRPGEVQAIKLSSYFSRKTGVDEVSDELTGKLTEFEKKLLLEQDMMEIRGKCGKFVPVIIPPYIKPLLKYITDSEVRHAAGISSTNNYVFASNRSGVIRGGYSLVVMSDAAGLSKPERIRGTAMRSFMATMSQGMNITPQQQQWIVDHMGHTLNVHNIHYRCTVDVIERIDISKLLLMMDHGQIARFKGKTLDDIKIEELLDHQIEHSEAPDPEPEEGAEMEEEYVYVPQQDDSEEIFEADVKKPKRKRKAIGKRHKWTPKEIEEVRQLFSAYFKKDKTPGERAVRKAMDISKAKGGTLWKLPLKSIKAKVSWLRLKCAD